MPERMVFVRFPQKDEYIAHVNDDDQVWLEPDGDNIILRAAPKGSTIPEFAQVAFLNQRIDLLHRGIGILLEPERVMGIAVMKELYGDWGVYERRVNGTFRLMGPPMKKRQARRIADEMRRSRWP